MPEPTVPPSTPMPSGYCFVRKGNVYITAHCRKASVAAGHPVYTVVASAAPGAAVLGLRCPRDIYRAVCAEEAASRTARADATAKRDASLANAFRTALLAHYPAVPADRVPVLVQHAMAKHQGRVARTATLDLAARVRLAVRAHIRHRDTAYEQLLGEKGKKGGKKSKANAKTREAVRTQIVAQVDAIERAWKTATRTADEAEKTDTKTTVDETKMAKPETIHTTPLRVTPAGRVPKQRASKNH